MKKFPTILIDTREKKPFTFKGYRTLKRKLNFGDYSLQGFIKNICIERKSLSDFFSTLSNKKNFERFKRELMEMSRKDYAYIVVEASPEQILFGSKYSTINGYRILDKAFEINFCYGISIIFGGNRIGAEACALSILRSAFYF